MASTGQLRPEAGDRQPAACDRQTRRARRPGSRIHSDLALREVAHPCQHVSATGATISQSDLAWQLALTLVAGTNTHKKARREANSGEADTQYFDGDRPLPACRSSVIDGERGLTTIGQALLRTAGEKLLKVKLTGTGVKDRGSALRRRTRESQGRRLRRPFRRSRSDPIPLPTAPEHKGDTLARQGPRARMRVRLGLPGDLFGHRHEQALRAGAVPPFR
jgi:hypothetical protein